MFFQERKVTKEKYFSYLLRCSPAADIIDIVNIVVVRNNISNWRWLQFIVLKSGSDYIHNKNTAPGVDRSEISGDFYIFYFMFPPPAAQRESV